MKLVFATEYYDPHRRGGSATSIRELAEALVAVGHLVIIVTPNWGGAPRRERPRSGMQIRRFRVGMRLTPGQPVPSRVFLTPWFHAAFAAAIAGAAIELRADLVHAQDKHAIVGTYLAGLATRRPAFATIRDVGVICPIATCLLSESLVPPDCGQIRMQRTCAPFFMDYYAHPSRLRTRASLAWRLADTRLKAIALRRMRRVIGLSAGHLHICEVALGLTRTRVVPNVFVPPPPLPAARATPPMVLTVGQVTLGKGFPVFAAAASAVQASLGRDAVQFVSAGDAIGSPMAKYLRGPVRRLGQQSTEAVRRLYQEASIVVHPSMVPEASSRVCLEAAAAERPVIVSGFGGGRESVDHGVTGLVVPRGNDRALADAMRELLGDPAYAIELGQNARRVATQRFGPQAVIPKLIAAYEDA